MPRDRIWEDILKRTEAPKEEAQETKASALDIFFGQILNNIGKILFP